MGRGRRVGDLCRNHIELSKEDISKGDGIDDDGLKLWFTNADKPHCSTTVFLTKELTIEDFYYRGGGWNNITPFGSVVDVGNHNVYLPNHVTVKQLLDDDGKPVPAGDSGGKIYYMCDTRPDLRVVQSEVEEDGKTVTVLTLYEGSEPVPEGYYFRSGDVFYYGNGENAYKAYGGDDGFISFWPVKSYAQGTVYPMGDKPVGRVHDTDENGDPEFDENGNPKYLDYTLGCGIYTTSRDSHYEARPDYWSTVYVGQNYFYYIGGGFLYTGNVSPTVSGSKISIGNYQVDMGEGVAIAWLPNDTIDGSQATDEWNWPHAYARYKADDYHYQIADQRFIIYPNNSWIGIKDVEPVYRAGDTANIVIELKQLERGMSVFVNGSFYQRFEGYGDHPLTIPDLREGKYTIDVFGDGDDCVTRYQTYTSFTVVKTDPVLTLSGTTPAGAAFADGGTVQYDPDNCVVVNAVNDKAVSGTSWRWTIMGTDVVTQDHITNTSQPGEVNSEDLCLNTVGLGDVTVTARFSGNEIYNPAKASISFTVVPMAVSNPIVAVQDEDKIVYDGQAKEPAVKVYYAEGKEIPADQYAVTYADNTNASTEAKVTVKSVAGALYTFEKTQTFTIQKADVTVVSNPSASAITYGQTLESSILTGGTASVAGSFAWTDKTVVPTVAGGSAGYSVTFTPNDAANYNTATATVALTVDPKSVTITGLSAENKTYDGTTAATVTGTATIDGKVDGDDVSASAGSASFADANVANGKAVTFSGYTLTGDDAGNYKLSGQPASVTANISAKSITGAAVTLSATTFVYSGGARSVSVTGVKVGDLTLTTDDYDVSGSLTGTNVDTYTVTVTGKGNFKDTAEATWAITEKPMTVSAPNVTATYDGQARGIAVSVTDPASGYTVKYGEAEGTYDLDASPTITKAGAKTVYFRVTADNYQTYTGSATITVNRAALTVTAGSATQEYDGTALTKDSYTNTDLAEGDSIESVTVTGSQTVFGSSNNVPSAAVIVNGSGEDVTLSYAITYANGTLTVTQKALTVTADSDSKEYDGTALTKDSYTNTALATGDSIESVTVTGSQTVVGSSNNVPSAAKIVNGSGADVTASYDITYANGMLTVNRKAVTITADSDSKTYDGTALTKSSTTNTALATGDSIESVTVTGSQTVAGSSSNVPSAAKIVNGANADVTGSYDITYANGTLKVTPKAVTITADNDSKTYDGTALTKSSTTNTALATGDSIESVTVAGSQTVVGSSNNVPSAAVIVNGSGADVTASYDITYANGTLTVNRKAVTLTAKDASRTYNGSALTEGGFTASALEAGDTHTFAVAMTAGSTITNAGTQPNVIATVDGTAVTAGTPTDVGNYSVTAVNGTLTVNRKDATITTGSAGKAYDGTALTNAEASITGLIEGESVTLSAAGSQTEVGSSNNTYSITWDDAVAGNYSVTENLGTLTVTSNTAEVVLTAASAGKTYDGTALTAGGVTASGLPDGFTVTATASGSQTDAGSSANVVNDGYVIRNAAGADRTASFANLAKVNGTLTVNKKAATISTGSAGKQYDGTALTCAEASITGLVEGEGVTLSAAGSQTEVGESDNTYSITWDSAKAGNYSVTENLGKLTVTVNSSAITLTAASASKTYDGTALTNAAVTASGLPDGFTVTATASGSQTDVGSSANAVNDGYVIRDADGADRTASFTNVKKAEGTLTVEPKGITGAAVALSAAELTYNGASQGVTVTGVTLDGKALAAGDYTVSGSTAGTDADTYTVTVTGQGNYKDSAATTWRIVPKPVTITGLGAENKVYDGKTDAAATGAVVISGVADGDDVSVVAGTAAFADANAGTGKTVTFSGYGLTGDRAKNYALSAQPASVKADIAAKAVGLSWSNTSFTYDGESHAPTATATGLIGGDACTVTVTGAQTNAGDHTAAASALSNANYALPAENTQAFTIGRKALTVVANDASKIEGEADPALTYTVTGLVCSDTLTGTLTRAAGEAVGTYAITQGTLKASDNYTMTFTGATFTIRVKPGEIDVDADIGEGVPPTKVEGLTKEVAQELATPEERSRVEAGETLLVYLDIENIDATVSEADREKIVAAAAQQDPAARVGMVLDLSMYKKIGNDSPTKLTDLHGHKISFTLAIPAGLRKAGRTFFIVRLHELLAQIIARGSGDSITGESDLFSTYALIYVDEAQPTPTPTPTPTPVPADPDAMLLAELMASGDTSFELSWTEAGGAEGYDVFFARCDGMYALIQSVTGSRSCNIEGLIKGKTYRAYVKAWKMENGAKAYIGTASPPVHAIAGDFTKTKTNAGSVTVKTPELTLVKGKSKAIKATVKGVNSGRTVLAHVRKLRYYSSDRKVATVTSTGRVKAKGGGTCTIYVIANNGVRDSVKVTVVDQPTMIAFKKSGYSVKKGKTLKLAGQIKLTPSGVKSVCTWTSSDPSVATVSGKGVVKGVEKGTATITATSANGKTATAEVRVK